jgi:hypothetical protein
MTETKKSERGLFATIGLLVGGGCLLVAALSVINTAFDLNLAIGSRGSSTAALPDSWGAVAALAIGGLLIVALSLFGSLVATKFAEAKGKPKIRIVIITFALIFLGVVGRGLQILALVNTYGSMLAYYATDGDLEDVRSELAKEPDHEALDNAVSRAAQYNNAAALALLMKAGADMRDESSPADRRSCALLGTSYEFIKTALAHGVTPESCTNGEAAIWEVARFADDDAEAAKIIGLLLDSGWSASAIPDKDEKSATELVAEKEWSESAALLARG